MRPELAPSYAGQPVARTVQELLASFGGMDFGTKNCILQVLVILVIGFGSKIKLRINVTNFCLKSFL